MKLSDGYVPNLVFLLAVSADNPAETPRGHITSSDHDLTPSHIFVPALQHLELYAITFIAKEDL